MSRYPINLREARRVNISISIFDLLKRQRQSAGFAAINYTGRPGNKCRSIAVQVNRELANRVSSASSMVAAGVLFALVGVSSVTSVGTVQAAGQEEIVWTFDGARPGSNLPPSG